MSDPFRLDGLRILVTGASSGIGRAIAVAASRAGGELVVTGRHRERLDDTAASLDGDRKHASVVADLTRDADLDRIVEVAGHVDGVVHAAGIAGPIPIRVTTRAFVEERFNANFFAPVLLSQRLLARNRVRPGGSVVFLASISAHTGTRGMAIYGATKASLLVTAKCLALETAKHRIRVNCLSPGVVRTPIFTAEWQAWLAEQEKRYPLGLGAPEDVAYATVFLLAPASRWMTGQTILMDGACEST